VQTHCLMLTQAKCSSGRNKPFSYTAVIMSDISITSLVILQLNQIT
jgi:hypothetical protein